MNNGGDTVFAGPGPEPGDADLFGPDPGTDPLAYYAPQAPASDLYATSAAQVRAAWHDLARGFAQQSGGHLHRMQDYLDRQVQDLGLAFRITGDEQERPWPLGPMPILIGAREWESVSDGLIQRAELLETVIADLYGKQSLVASGQLPASVVSGSRDIARRMVGMKPQGGRYLTTYAVDLARGPTGEWRVLTDRVRFPVGIGYAVENRQALARATGGLLASVGARSHSGFFEVLRKGIGAQCGRVDPRVALLTPGRFSQSYPEQAVLARHLGFALVEGRDLTVRDGRLFARTIAGLERIDALWRWITTRDLDPLNFDTRSQIGVPGLIGAASAGLALTNWPGVGVVESRAMPAFLPRLAQSLLGQPLALPNAATWWCGSETEREHVRANLDNLVISSAFRRPVTGLPDGHTRTGASLSPEERATLEAGLALRPMDYTAQEIVHLSTTPALSDGRLEARGFTIRAYLTRDDAGGWSVLQGGFGRVSEKGDLRTSLMGLGDLSSDVCIIDENRPAAPETVLETRPHEIRREQGLLPSQAADNLFWLGRYGERAQQTARILRVLIDQLSASGTAATTIERLSKLLRTIGAVNKPAAPVVPIDLARRALCDDASAGSVPPLLPREQGIAQTLRDRLSRDSWRALQKSLPGFEPDDTDSIALACDRVIERHAAAAALLAEGLGRAAEWPFLDMGLRLERASILLQATQAIFPGKASADDLSALLDLTDCQSLYRSRYLSMPFIPRVLDMVLLEPGQPRSLAFHIRAVEHHLRALPTSSPDAEGPLAAAQALRTRIETLDPAQIGPMTLQSLHADLNALSTAITESYFLHSADAA